MKGMSIRPLVSIAVLFVPAVSVAATWQVATSGCSDASCTPCCTIQAAVERCGPGDVVSVGSGTYAEQVDLRQMSTPGSIRLEAAAGPGTVLVSPASGRALTHSGSDTGTVTVDGIDFTSPDMTCVFLAHSGEVVLRDVVASGCGYHAFEIDATGSVSMERCTGSQSGRNGIQVDGAASVTLTDVEARVNPERGIYVLNVAGPVAISGALAEVNGHRGIDVDVSGGATILNSASNANTQRGFSCEGSGAFVLAGLAAEYNGEENIWVQTDGSISLASASVDHSGYDGVLLMTLGGVEVSDLIVSNSTERGLNVENQGDVSLARVDVSASGNHGIRVQTTAGVALEECVSTGSIAGHGIEITWNGLDPVDRVRMVGCTAQNSGLGFDGIRVQHVSGPVTIAGCAADGNLDNGFKLAELDGPLLIAGTTSAGNGSLGYYLANINGGSFAMLDSVADGNGGEGIGIQAVADTIGYLSIRRSRMTGNAQTGLELGGFVPGGSFEVACNDVAGNLGEGLRLWSAVDLDASFVWWGDPSGPSGEGPGSGDSVLSGPGVITFSPWLLQSITSPESQCEIFGSNMDSGSIHEWDPVVQ